MLEEITQYRCKTVLCMWYTCEYVCKSMQAWVGVGGGGGRLIPRLISSIMCLGTRLHVCDMCEQVHV